MPERYKCDKVPDCLGSHTNVQYVTHLDDVEDLVNDLLHKDGHTSQVDTMMRQLYTFIGRKCRHDVELSSSSCAVPGEKEQKREEDDEDDDSSGANMVPRIRFTLNPYTSFKRCQQPPVAVSTPPSPGLTEDMLRRVLREEMAQEARALALLDIYKDPAFIEARKHKMDEALEELKRQVHDELRPHHDEIRAQVRKRLEERFEREHLDRKEALLKRTRFN
jgi:hypothetical protein